MIPLLDGSELYVVIIHSDRWIEENRLKLGRVMQLHLPKIKFSGSARIEMIKTAETKGESEGHLHLAVRRHGENDPGTVLVGKWKPAEDALEERRRNLRSIELFMEHPDGVYVEISLMRSVDWIHEQGAKVGEFVFLEMAEMGARGWAKVLSIEPCPPLECGPGQLVTGTFRHSAGIVGDLKIASEAKPIGVTPSHLFWSVDRNDWVSAGDLEEGETVKTLDGFSHIEWFQMRSETEPVYNLEVEGDHVYRVGESGVLVHNTSAAYRLGGKTATNLTPRPGKDDGDVKGGLSMTECPGKGWTFPGGKSKLQALGFVTEDDPTDDDPTHFLVRPGTGFIANGWTLKKWAEARPSINNDDESTWPEPTKTLVKNAQPFNP